MAAVRNWEQERRSPDGAALSYLRVIAAYPEEAARAQEVDAAREEVGISLPLPKAALHRGRSGR